MSGLRNVEVPIFISKHSAPYRRHGYNVLADTKLVDNFAYEPMDHTVPAAGTVVILDIAKACGAGKDYMRLLVIARHRRCRSSLFF